MWHSQETTRRPAPHRFERCGGLLVCQPKPEIPNPAVRCRGIPPASRLQAEEDVNCMRGSI
ncbi:MAG: hypothetical protein J07HQW1_00641 [Haloquadratum walsbyi J07HQW1]|uniref:Uncharacterized protein n=1 Tax=Haloquadratum walsbyi J07HQW1 TaxID=1238424 RepID=U1PAN2_9EURY|nr:MAG: hypothetical protein J07HQW1_00641 [Haloquadratum walsbyi J07HQW1]